MFRYNDPVEAAKLRKEGSRSHLNLSRLSLLSWSTSDLARSMENLNTGDETDKLDEIEQKRAVLEKEREKFQREQTEKERDWELYQQQQKEALELAKKELEEEKVNLEQSYHERRKQLAADWQRLERQQKKTMAALRSREMELEKRREMLEWERDEEVCQIDVELKKIGELKEELDFKRQDVNHKIYKTFTNGMLSKDSENEDNSGDQNGSYSLHLNNAANLTRNGFLTNGNGHLIEEENCNGKTDWLCVDKPREELDSVPNSEEDCVEALYWQNVSTVEEGRKQVNGVKQMAFRQKEELANMEAELATRLKSLGERQERVGQLEIQLANLGQKRAELTNGGLNESKEENIEGVKKCIAQRTHQELLEIHQRKKSLSLDLKPVNGEAVEDKNDSSSHETFHTATSDCELFTNKQLTSGTKTEIETDDKLTLCNEETCDVNSTCSSKTENGCDLLVHNTRQSLNLLPVQNNSDHQSFDGGSLWKRTPNDGDVEELSSVLSGDEDVNSDTVSTSQDEDKQSSSSCAKSAASKDTPSSTEVGSFEKLSPFHGPLASREMEKTRLWQKVSQQKLVVLHCLESDCDNEELNKEIIKLQELQREYWKMELALDKPRTRTRIATAFEDGGEFLKDSISQPLSSSYPGMQESQNKMYSREQNNLNRERSSRLERTPQNQDPLRTKHRLSQPNIISSPLSSQLCSSISSQEGESQLLSPYSLGITRSLSFGSSLGSPSSNDGSEYSKITVRIPSYVLRGAGTSTHYEYEVKIFVGREKWCVLRRYKRFRELHLYMRATYGPKIDDLPFPPRKFFSKNSESVAKERRKLLEVYLQKLLSLCAQFPSCSLYRCRDNPTRDSLVEFSSFFRKGLFETGKHGTS